ncbi:MAG: DUF2188 domain-containing protein [Bryobacterales bacterium]|nr:DUF2188 domain-containing protein [Bryobacterales bacterium]
MKITAKTMHVVPNNGGWAVMREGSAASTVRVYATQKEAVRAAREIVRRTVAGQVVIHGADGSMRTRDRHGLPMVQPPPRKSTLGSKAIAQAVSTVIRERLAGE